MKSRLVTVNLAASRAFAALSGDFNPQHLDPILARRLLFGGTVVHGIHLILLALDTALRTETRMRPMTSIEVLFAAPVSTGTEVSIDAGGSRQAKEAYAVRIDQKTMVTIDVTWGDDLSYADQLGIPDLPWHPSEPTRRTMNDAGKLEGRLPLVADRHMLAALFPCVAARLPIEQAAMLLASTRLVGMECPGMDSIFASMSFEFAVPSSDAGFELRYAVTGIRAQLRFCAMRVNGPGATGQIKAIFRPSSAAQPGMAEVRARVSPGEFAGQRAAIVGGSRGLGELTAKILAAGDATVAIGYARGEEDATRVAEDIASAGGHASIFQFDATSRDSTMPASIEGKTITHVYYFATPRIEPGTPGNMDDRKIELYRSYYVQGLDRLLSRLLEDRVQPLTLFNPSTIYLDEPDPKFAEYAAAKAESEALCKAYVQRASGNLNLLMPRLQRLKTDQTMTLQGGEPPGALDTLLSVLPRAS